jgi:hypothetical protein
VPSSITLGSATWSVPHCFSCLGAESGLPGDRDASITVTAHIYADLWDDELDDIAVALNALNDARRALPQSPAG